MISPFGACDNAETSCTRSRAVQYSAVKYSKRKLRQVCAEVCCWRSGPTRPTSRVVWPLLSGIVGALTVRSQCA